MAKTKAPKEKKEKKNAPVTEVMYGNAMLMIKLVSEIQKELAKKSEITGVRLVPKIEGYQIFFKENDIACKINIEKRTLLSGYSVKKYVDGFKKVSVGLKEEKDYEAIIAKLFGYKKEKLKRDGKK